MPSSSPHPCLRWLFQWRMVFVLFLAPILLTGCVDYGLNIRFDHPNRGEIVQHIQLGERFSSLGGVAIQEWLQTIEQRSRSLGGRVKRLSEQEMLVQIPFGSSDDLETKFNQFFHPTAGEPRSGMEGTTLPDIDSHLSVSHSNFLLVERDHLTYDLDVRSLGVTAADGNVLVSPTSLIDLEFRLQTPWGAQSTIATDTLQPIASPDGTQLLWRLVPGDKNHLEATFWMPNWLGIGTVMILLFVGLGTYIKYPRSPRPPLVTDS
ncbi:DUF3153 domain-containing protein [Pantanalinema rosaneae CENA516]|uniref:DUF3153 domain-containing protein n=1 Tax=Pantanalinema rosaneae TaxID=1620701 RepID=UPI003D6F7379